MHLCVLLIAIAATEAAIVVAVFLSKKKTSAEAFPKYDFLTKCLNRRSLLEDMDRYPEYTIFFCDLDNFKHLNDTLGHNAGDELLKQTAKTWQSIKSTVKFNLYRNGGDEFIFLLFTTDKVKAEMFADKILSSFKSNDSVYFSYVSASVGLAFKPESSTSTNELLTFSDNAMYSAKTSGKSRYVVFNESMHNAMLSENKLKSALSDILDGKSDFNLVYQPQVDMKTGDIIGVECLLRVNDLNGKLFDTQSIVYVAEANNMITQLDDKIVEKALKETKELLEIDKSLKVSVNFSGKHASMKNFAEAIYDVLANCSFPIQSFEIEITEESYMKNMTIATSNIDRLHRLGISIALDDFGSGYSSLKYLSNFKINILKIDKSFIEEIDDCIKILILIVNIGHDLGAKVVAEGVENSHQYVTLKNIGCDAIQGFYLYKPMPIDKLKTVLRMKTMSSEQP